MIVNIRVNDSKYRVNDRVNDIVNYIVNVSKYIV